MGGMNLLLHLVIFSAFGDALGLVVGASLSAMFILGDSSVNCGYNHLYSFLDESALLYRCDGSQTSFLPDLLAEKMGLPEIPPFYSQNGTIEGLLGGLNFGSSPATIMNTGKLGFQSLNQQLRQASETLQLLQLQLGQDKAQQMINSSLFYLSFGKDDYVELFLHDISGLRHRFGAKGFAQVLVNQITRVIKDLYYANVRKIIYMGLGPLGCAPRTVWENSNSTAEIDGGLCIDWINEMIIEYNAIVSSSVVDMGMELRDAQIIFCDVYKGMMNIINNPRRYGFENVHSACCGIGRYGGMVGCVSKEVACEEPSTHVWWDFYNPTKAVNSLLAHSIWFGQPLFDICLPISIQQLTSMR